MRCINVFNVRYQIHIFFSTLVFSFICLHLGGVPNLVLGQYSKSGLCRNESASCSHQIHDPTEECFMKFYNSSGCNFVRDKNIKSSSDEDHGIVRLTTHLISESLFTAAAFNITFSLIRWKRIQMWFLKQPNKGETNTLPDSCREFEVASNISLDAVLFYDCLPRFHSEEGQVYRFQYKIFPLVGEPTLHTYLFKVPISKNIDLTDGIKDYKLFLLVDISDFRNLQLQIQVAPPQFNITRYKVHLWRSSSAQGNSWIVFSQTIIVPRNTTANTIIKSRYFDTLNKPGIYRYEVQIENQHCDKNVCITEGPHLLILPNLEAALLIAIVGVVLMVPVLIAGFFIWRRWGVFGPPEVLDDPRKPKSILLIYNPYYPAHVDNVIGFNNFLRSCNLDPMLDLFRIPATESKDPTKWYTTEAEKADNILVLASPQGSQSNVPHRLNTYSHLDDMSLNRLRSKLALKGPCSHAVSVQLPNCSWDTLPEEARHLRKFMLPRDLDPLLVYLGSAPKYDNGAAFLAALEQACSLRPQPAAPSVIPYTISQNFPEPSSEARTPIDPEGRELILSGEDYEEELEPLCIGKSITLNLSGNC